MDVSNGQLGKSFYHLPSFSTPSQLRLKSLKPFVCLTAWDPRFLTFNLVIWWHSIKKLNLVVQNQDFPLTAITAQSRLSTLSFNTFKWKILKPAATEQQTGSVEAWRMDGSREARERNVNAAIERETVKCFCTGAMKVIEAFYRHRGGRREEVCVQYIGACGGGGREDSCLRAKSFVWCTHTHKYHTHINRHKSRSWSHITRAWKTNTDWDRTNEF